jgi:hypothetical protein
MYLDEWMHEFSQCVSAKSWKTLNTASFACQRQGDVASHDPMAFLNPVNVILMGFQKACLILCQMLHQA